MIAFSAVLLLLFGLILAVGGAYLVWLGGSGYYLIAGLAFALSAVYLLQKRSRGLTLFAITLVATYVWALWESGYDWWPLAARVGLPSLFGLWFVLPFFRRAWQRQSPDGTRSPLWWRWPPWPPLAASPTPPTNTRAPWPIPW